MDLPALTVDDPQHWTRWLAGSLPLMDACAKYGIGETKMRQLIDASVIVVSDPSRNTLVQVQSVCEYLEAHRRPAGAKSGRKRPGKT